MKFDWYFEPSSVRECVELLEEYGPEARLLAGGTDLVVRLRSRTLKVKTIISLGGLKELTRINKTDDGLVIGAMARLMDVSKSELLAGPWSVVKKGAGHVSSMQVRNVGTIGGNTCNASPSADTIPGLMALDAQALIAGPRGDRVQPLDGFFKGPGQTALERGEMLTGFKLPNFGPGNGCAYKKYAIRGDTDIAIVGVGARLQVGSGGKVDEARLILGAVAPTPLRVPEVEKLLIGQTLTDDLKSKVAQAAADACNPITDARATREYRKEMIRVWTRHVLTEAYNQATV